MTIDEYLIFSATRLKDAQDRGSKYEVIRLLKLIADTCNEKVYELIHEPDLKGK